MSVWAWALIAVGAFIAGFILACILVVKSFDKLFRP